MSKLYVRKPDAAAALRFMDTVLGVKPWSKQLEIVRSVFGPKRRTAVRSAHGVGKTYIAAAIGLAWLFTGPYRTVITSAPTMRQVTKLLWKEIRKLVRGAGKSGTPLGGTLLPKANELFLEEDWQMIGFASDDPINVQGWHCPGGTLVILDEAMGIHEAIWEALQGVLVGANDRLLAVANPTRSSGPFFELCKAEDTEKIVIAAADSPNVVEGREVIPGLVTAEWVVDRKRAWGEDSPLWRARGMGEFPDEADNVLVPLSWIHTAQSTWEPPKGLAGFDGATVEQALDVARYGDDKTILATLRLLRDFWHIDALDKTVKRDTMETAGHAARVRRDLGASVLRIDADGIGAGVFDRLAELREPVVEMRGGRTANESDRFTNARSEWLWTFREALRPKNDEWPGKPLLLPPDDDLLLQATSLMYREKSDGRIQIETKDDWRKRTRKSSTDELDAVAMAVARGAGDSPFAFGRSKQR